MTWAAFTDKLVQNVKYAGTLAASLFTAPYLRELFDMVADNTVGRPTSPYAYVPYVIAREGVGYLGAPVVIQAATQIAQRSADLIRKKIKPNTEDTHSAAVVPVARLTTENDLEQRKQKLQQLLDNNPDAKNEVQRFSNEIWGKLLTSSCSDKVLTQLATLSAEDQQKFFARFANKFGNTSSEDSSFRRSSSLTS